MSEGSPTTPESTPEQERQQQREFVWWHGPGYVVKFHVGQNCPWCGTKSSPADVQIIGAITRLICRGCGIEIWSVDQFGRFGSVVDDDL